MIKINTTGNISIIVVTWNSEDCIRQCLAALDMSQIHEQMQIIVIDNHSCDKTPSIVAREFPSIQLVVNPHNMRLTRALNQGLHLASGKYILFLNPDVSVAPSTIALLHHYICMHPDVGIVGPRLFYPDGTLQYSCRTFPTLRTIATRGAGITEHSSWMPRWLHRHLMTDFSHYTTQDVDWMIGACLLLRKEMIEKMGHLDGKYPLYYGDVDLCWRAQKSGWKVVYVADANAIHTYQRASAHGGLLNPLRWSHAKSALRFLLKKNFGGGR